MRLATNCGQAAARAWAVGMGSSVGRAASSISIAGECVSRGGGGLGRLRLATRRNLRGDQLDCGWRRPEVGVEVTRWQSMNGELAVVHKCLRLAKRGICGASN